MDFIDTFAETLVVSNRKRKRDVVETEQETVAIEKPIVKVPAIDFSSKWFLAFYRNDKNTVSYLLHQGRIDPNVTTQHELTALFLSCVKNQISLVQLLLADPRTDVNKINMLVTPLSIAVIAGNRNIVALLLNHPDIDLNKQNADESTALDKAIERLAYAQKTDTSIKILADRALILSLIYDAMGDRTILSKM